MVISDIIRGILVLSIPFFIAIKQIIPVYFIIFLTFSISRFFVPSKMAMIPSIVPKERLLVANALNDTTHMIGNVVGLVVAGLIVNVACIGAIGGFYIDAATFFISASLIGMMVRAHFAKGVRGDLMVTGQAIESSIRRSIFAEVKEGVNCLAGYGSMRFVVTAFFFLMAGVGSVSCVIIVFIQDAFGSSTRDLGILGMFLVAGLLLGTLFYGRFCQKFNKKKIIYSSFIMTGVAITLFSYFVKKVPNIFLGGFFASLIGASASPMMTAMNTITHETIPSETRGRIFSSLEVVIHMAFLIFMFLAAETAGFIDRLWILIGVGVMFVLYGSAGMAAGNLKTKTT
jgi:DHA3 family macrolide efflux protein-like MFS transporter